LMFFHRRHENFLGKRQILSVEGTDEDLWHFNREDSLIQECLIFMQEPFLLPGDLVHLRGDHGPSSVLIPDNAGLLQCLVVRSEVLDAKRSSRREKPMAIGAIARRQPRKLEPDGFPAVEGQDPADRTRESDVCLVPPHGLRKRKTAHQLREKSGQ